LAVQTLLIDVSAVFSLKFFSVDLLVIMKAGMRHHQIGIEIMLRLAILSSVVCWALFSPYFSAPFCSAQTSGQSRSYNQSGTGQGSIGQGSRGAFGGSTGQGQSRGGAGFGASSFGAPGEGFGGQAAGGFGLGQQTQGNNQIGAGLGADTFIGNDAQQTQDFFRNLNGGQRRTQMFDFMIENLNEMRDRGGRGNGQDRTPPVRVKLRPAFETPLGTIGQIDADIQSRLATSATELGVVDPRMTMNGRTLVLEGKVATDHDRKLAEQMMLLEPGVNSVENRLTVEPKDSQQ
jgi:hypothetical protein